MQKNSSGAGSDIGRVAAMTLWKIYGDELRALPEQQQVSAVLAAMQSAVPRALVAARLEVDESDPSRINELVTHAADTLEALLIARAGHRKLRELQAANASAATAAAIARASA